MLPLLPSDGAERGDELAPGIGRICGKELVVLRFRAGLPQHMQLTTETAIDRKVACPEIVGSPGSQSQSP